MISFCTSDSSRLTITEHNNIGEIALTWDIILPPNHSLFSKNLEVLEVSNPEGMDFKYLLIHKNETLAGLVYLQHLKITTNHFDGTSIDKPGLGWLKKCIKNQFSDVLICGNIFRIHFPGFYFKNENDEALIFELLMDYINSDKENKRYCGLLLKDCPHQLYKTGKFKPYHDDVTMEIEIKKEWNVFEDYKNSLSKKYKQRCSKIQLTKQKLVLKEFSLQEITENAARIEQLYLNVALKQSMRIGFVNAAYFIEMKRRHSENFVFRGYFLHDELIAFSSHILYPDNTMEIHFIGLDYDFNENYCLYFNILFDGLDLAINRGMHRLELGRTARVAKASLGAMPVEVHNHVFLRKGIPSLAFAFFNNRFVNTIGDDWKQRSPFK